RAETGAGVQALLSGETLLGGKPRWLAGQGVSGLDPLVAEADRTLKGRTVIAFSQNGKALGLIAVSDPIKATSPEAIKALHRLGLRIVMLTGDNATVAEAVARDLGI